MTIEIRDAALEARLKKRLQSTGSRSVEEVLLHLLETQEEQDRWLSENREAINAQIRRGIEQLDHGEGIPDYQLQAHLKELRMTPSLDDDAFLLLKRYAASHSLTPGKAVSELVRRALATRPTRSINGLQVFDLAPQSPKVSSKRMRKLESDQN